MLQIDVLGNVEARVGGRQIEVGPSRQQCVLVALLVDANRAVPVGQLVDRVWGDRPPLRVRGTLHSYLTRLRRALAMAESVAIARRSDSYVLTIDEMAVDLHRFRHLVAEARSAEDDRALALLERALELWRGEAFAGLDTAWINSIRAILDKERRAVELDHTDLRLRSGQHTALLATLSTQVEQHPLDERLAGQLMLALYRSGRQAEALEHYEQMRRRLAEELGTDPSPALQDLHQQVLTADLVLAAPTGNASSRQSPTPRQLPPAPRSFFGRTAELATLTAALDTASEPGATVVISALAGAGGIGKTWLALHWAHGHLDHFPDGQLFVDLRGFSPDGQPMSTSTALRGFLDAFGVDPTQIPVDVHAQASLLRTLLADKRILMVLDNAADTTQVNPLLPGSPTATVLVTSRHHLPGLITRHGAHHLHVNVLTDNEARSLLTARLGAERITADPTAVDDLLAICSGFPLALGIVAGRAHTHPHLPLAVLAAELREATLGALDADDPTASLPAVLSWSYQALTSEQQHVFGLLGIAPGPHISLSAAASLTALTPAQTRRVLQALQEASLLDRDAHDRYTMHDLIRAYATHTAQHHLDEDTRTAALRRILDHYTHTAHTADRLLNPSRHLFPLDPPTPGAHPHPLSNTSAALAWLEVTYPNMLAAQHTATIHNWHLTVWHLAQNLFMYQVQRSYRHDRLAMWQAALDAATHLPDPTALITTHRSLGQSYAELGRHDDGFRHLHHALTLAEHHHAPIHQAHAHRALAQASERRGHHQQARQHAIQALNLHRAHGQPEWEADALNDVGWYAARCGDFDTARTHCQTALTLYRHLHSPGGEAAVLDSLGYIAYRTGDHYHALDHYQGALTLSQDLGDITHVAAALDALGHPHTALGQFDQARAVWQEALQLYQELGRDNDAARVQQQLNELDTRHGGTGSPQ